MIGLFAFAVAVAYLPLISSAGGALRWFVAAIAVRCLIARRKPAPLPLPGILFVAWATLSLAWSFILPDAMGHRN
jgi:hypothetical protein